MSATRTLWRTPKAGSLDRLSLVTEPLPPLAPGQVRVATRAVGLNFADVFAVLGLYSATPPGAFCPGLECAGLVEAVGSDVTALRPGDAVIALTRFGGYASHADVDPAYCLPLPAGWSFAEGSALLVQALTALYALKTLGDVKPGQSVLVHSAAGGVGLLALELCRRFGAHAIGSVGSEAKARFLRERGHADVFVRGRSIRADVRRLLAGRDLSLVLEAVGGKVFRESYALLAPTGRLVTFGAATFAPKGASVDWLAAARRYLTRPKLDPLAMISDNKSVMGFNLIWLWERLDLLQPLLDELAALGLPRPHVGRAFAFEEAKAALAYLKSGASVGKVVLTRDASRGGLERRS